MGSVFQKGIAVLSGITDRIATTANVVGSLVVLGLVLVVDTDVIARGLFNSPFRGAIEVVQFSMVLIVFLQLPDVARAGRLTRSDGLLIMLGDRYPRLVRFIQRCIDLLSAIVMALIFVAIWPDFWEMWETKDYFGIPGVFTAPWWPIKLTIVCSAALCFLIFLFKVLRKPQAEADNDAD